MMKETGGRAWFTVDVHAPVLLGWSLWIVAGSKQRGGRKKTRGEGGKEGINNK